jgi:GPH family glycoside/pentoside/hexuronide:cation symporter
VSPGTIDRLTIVFVALHASCGLIAALFYRYFPFGRAEHEARLARMRASG